MYFATLRDFTSTNSSRFLPQQSKCLATIAPNNEELCSEIIPSPCLLGTCHLLPLMPRNPSVVIKLKDQSSFILSLGKSLFIPSLAYMCFLPSPMKVLSLQGLISPKWKSWYGYCIYFTPQFPRFCLG